MDVWLGLRTNVRFMGVSLARQGLLESTLVGAAGASADAATAVIAFLAILYFLQRQFVAPNLRMKQLQPKYPNPENSHDLASLLPLGK